MSFLEGRTGFPVHYSKGTKEFCGPRKSDGFEAAEAVKVVLTQPLFPFLNDCTFSVFRIMVVCYLRDKIIFFEGWAS